jgi:hypothetical protein
MSLHVFRMAVVLKILYNLIINIRNENAILVLLNVLINFHPAEMKIQYNKYNSCFILFFFSCAIKSSKYKMR